MSLQFHQVVGVLHNAERRIIAESMRPHLNQLQHLRPNVVFTNLKWSHLISNTFFFGDKKQFQDAKHA